MQEISQAFSDMNSSWLASKVLFLFSLCFFTPGWICCNEVLDSKPHWRTFCCSFCLPYDHVNVFWKVLSVLAELCLRYLWSAVWLLGYNSLVPSEPLVICWKFWCYGLLRLDWAWTIWIEFVFIRLFASLSFRNSFKFNFETIHLSSKASSSI